MFRLSLSAKVAFAQLAQMTVLTAAMVFLLITTGRLFDRTAAISELLEPAAEKLEKSERELAMVAGLLENASQEDLRRADRILARNRPVRMLRNVARVDLTALTESTDIDEETRNRLRHARSSLEDSSGGQTPAVAESERTIDELRTKMTAAAQDPVNSRLAARELAQALAPIRLAAQMAARDTAAAARDAAHELVSKRSSLWTTILAVSAGSLLLSIVFLILAIRSTMHIGEITMAVRRLAAGDLSHVSIRASRELEETAEAINQLGSAFRAQREAGAVEKEREVRTERLAVIGRMASAVAHEIRNPLNSISLNMDLLADMLESPDRYPDRRREVIAVVQREIDRLNGITEDYLQFGRMPKSVIGPCNVTNVVMETRDFMAGEFMARNATVRVSSFDSGAKVLSDEGQLRQALVNILRNSLEAMPEGGEVTVSIESGSDGISLAVTDCGQGIPEAHKARLFEPFATTKRGGTGLGLAFVQQVVNESGGRVEIESEEGNGTTVRITLRRAV